MGVKKGPSAVLHPRQPSKAVWGAILRVLPVLNRKKLGVIPMRAVVTTVLAFASALSARADQIQFANVVKASLVFRDDFDAARRYPHVLKVFLRLDNIHDSEVSWVANQVRGIEAELLDADGKPVPHSSAFGSIQSNVRPFNLPYGSRLDWLITHGGVSMMADASNKYALVIGRHGWLIAIDTASSYSLRIRLHGYPWTSALLREQLGQPTLLLDLPPAKLEITQ